MLTFCISFDYCVVELDLVTSFVVTYMVSEDHVFVEVACIEKAGRESNLLDVSINMMFASVH
jgi:hypothetical protein